MKKRKLNYRFHNPNTAEVTADYLAKILVEVNAKKVEKAIEIAMTQPLMEQKSHEEHPAQENVGCFLYLFLPKAKLQAYI